MGALGDLKSWCRQWEPIEEAGDVSSGGINRNHVNIIIRGWSTHPPSPELLPSIPFFEARHAYLEKNRSKPPSSGGQPAKFQARQRHIDTAIFCGRPASNRDNVPSNQTIPPTLLHPVFSQFVEDCGTYEPTVHDHGCLAELVHEMTVFFKSEGDRMSKFRDVMLLHGLTFTISNVNERYPTNGDVRVTVDGLNVYIAFVEGKNEVGSTGAEPFFQSILYWIEGIRKLEQADFKKFKYTNHPCLLIVHFGPYIGVAGAVFADHPNVQMLAPLFPLNFHPTDTSMKMMGARYVGAIKKAVRSLEEYYQTGAFSSPCQTRYPFPSSFTDIRTSRLIKFTYECQYDEAKLVFFARVLDTQESICVKFVRRYSKEAHIAFDMLGSAPKLKGFEYVPGGWYLVAMDDVRSEYRDFVSADRTAKLQAAVTAKLEEFHHMGYVHGDIRDVNLMVGKEDSMMFMLLDFDWAGVEDESKYPMNVNRGPELWRPDDAVDGLPIRREHDLAMLDHIFGNQSSH